MTTNVSIKLAKFSVGFSLYVECLWDGRLIPQKPTVYIWIQFGQTQDIISISS